MLFKIVDNYEQCDEHNIVGACYKQHRNRRDRENRLPTINFLSKMCYI